MRVFRDRLQDILDAIVQIERYRTDGKVSFDANPLLQVWMVHHLLIVEARLEAVDPDLRQLYPFVPWREMAGLKELLLRPHGRFDRAIVWDTVKNHVPALKTALERVLAELPEL
jgi:uncharacterized protein with HEPN domain